MIIASAPNSLTYSIIIASYRRPALLRQTVAALNPQLGPDGELLVIEQEPLEVLSAFFQASPFVRHHALPRRGTCEARNHGVRLARGQIAIFLDDDVIPEPDLIREHLQPYSDETVGGVAGRSIEAGIEPAAHLNPLALHPENGWWYDHFDHPHPRDLLHAPTKNLSFRTDLIRKVGGFDPAFRFAWREDSDLCFRVRRLGYRIVYHPPATLTHLHANQGGTRGTAAVGLVGREFQMYARQFRHDRDNLYFLLRHFHGRARRHWIWRSYRDFVGLSRWPWRLLAKNACFAAAIVQAAALARHRAHCPCRIEQSESPDACGGE